MNTTNPLRQKGGFRFTDFLINNNVTILFVILCVVAYFVSGTNLTFLLPELFTRISRNTFLVLSLLIPVIAGLGLNFSIVIGAVAAQIAIFLVVLWGFKGFTGLLLCIAICTPLAIFFGWLVGALFNRMKGTEMIGGMVAGYFSDGLYQFLFLFIFGGLIKIDSPLMISTGIGVKNTINLQDNLKYSLDNVSMLRILEVAFWAILGVCACILVFRLIKKQALKIKKILLVVIPTIVLYALTYIPAIERFLATDRLLLLDAITIGVIVVVAYSLYQIVRMKLVKKQPGLPLKQILLIAGALLLYLLTHIPALEVALIAVRLPVLTYLCIGGLCLFIPWFTNTRLGQNMRTVGQNRGVATSAGINVDRTRIIAMIMSTVLASYGQLISLQNIGTVSTYGSHLQVGQFAIAALLVGGASTQKATIKQGILGVILFHTLFILSPLAGKALLGNAQIGEYFRVFVAYGVIAVALAMHAWHIVAPKVKKVNGSKEAPLPETETK
ncbi:MAG: ABC transporter permease subunit [Oscillospiraceae bacterium]